MNDRKSLSVSRRKFLHGSAAAAAILSLSIPAAVLAQEPAVPMRGGVLKIGLGGGSASDSLDPALAAPTPTRLLARQWGDTLLRLGDNHALVGRLAASFAPNADATEWTFTLRDGVKFSDGTPLTAEDVAETYRRHANPESNSVILASFKEITAIEAVGNTVMLRTAKPNADLPYLLADYHLPIQPRGGRDNPIAAIGTGPYRITEASPGVRYVLEKNEHDWDPDRGFYDGLEILILNDGTLRTSALQSGAVHMINLVDPKIAGMFAQAPNVTLVNAPSRAHYAFTAMIDQAPYNNPKIIAAMKYALNREEILEKILSGYGQIGNDMPFNSATPFFDATIEQRSFDLEKARALYAESGHDGSPIILNVANTVFPAAIDCAMLWQSSCAQAGIPLQVNRVSDEGYWSEVWLKQPFTADNFLGRAVQDQVYAMFFQSGADWNGTRYANAEFDQLMVDGRGEIDPVKRQVIYSQMQRKIHDETALFVPVFADFINAHSPNVAGWKLNSEDELMGGYAPSETWFTA